MSIEVKVADADDNTTIVVWHKNPGDQISVGEKLVDVETAKTTLEIEAQETGVLKEIVKKAGDTITNDDIIAIIDNT